MNEAKVIHTRAEANVKRCARVEGAEVLMPAGAEALLPDFIQVTWSYEPGDTAWQLTWMSISGYRIKKNGKPGERRESAYFSESNVDTAPDWAQQFMAEVAPQQTPYK